MKTERRSEKNMVQVKKICKTALGVSAIYIIAVLLSLVLCERVNDLESVERTAEYHQSLALHLF